MFKQIKAVAISAASLLVAASPVFAAPVVGTTLTTTKTTFGQITDLKGIFIWIYNFAYYLGWAFIVVGVMVALATLAYKLFFGEGEDAMKTVQSYMTKVVIIVIVGLLLISASFVMNIIFVDVFGATTPGFDPNAAPK